MLSFNLKHVELIVTELSSTELICDLSHDMFGPNKEIFKNKIVANSYSSYVQTFNKIWKFSNIYISLCFRDITSQRWLGHIGICVHHALCKLFSHICFINISYVLDY